MVETEASRSPCHTVKPRESPGKAGGLPGLFTVVLHCGLDVVAGGVEHAKVVVGAKVPRIEFDRPQVFGLGGFGRFGDTVEHAEVVVEVCPPRIELDGLPVPGRKFSRSSWSYVKVSEIHVATS